MDGFFHMIGTLFIYVESFSLFRYLMELATQQAFNVVIDEFQEFYNINESVYSDM